MCHPIIILSVPFPVFEQILKMDEVPEWKPQSLANGAQQYNSLLTKQTAITRWCSTRFFSHVRLSKTKPTDKVFGMDSRKKIDEETKNCQQNIKNILNINITINVGSVY